MTPKAIDYARKLLSIHVGPRRAGYLCREVLPDIDENAVLDAIKSSPNTPWDTFQRAFTVLAPYGIDSYEVRSILRAIHRGQSDAQTDAH